MCTAFDSRDPVALAEFYAALTGWPIERTDEDWVQLQSDGGATLAFQLAPDGRATRVAEHEDRPQQAHIDLAVPDLDEGEAQVLAIGATKAEVQPEPDDFRVFLDPASPSASSSGA